MRFKLIMTLVRPEISKDVIDAAKKAGATGNVSLTARGSGVEETKIFGISLEDKTDLVMFVVEEHIVQRVLHSIDHNTKLTEPGYGIAIVLDIERVMGFEKQIEKIKERLKSEHL